MKSCFVISPIGAEGSPERKHADRLLKYIINPAMERCGVRAHRGDHYLSPGKISEQILQAILKEDFCIAVLTGPNPNVFYELGIAQAAQRPVIMMIDKATPLPFDVADSRCVVYDFELEPMLEGVYVRQLVAHVEALQAGKLSVPILLPVAPPNVPPVVVCPRNQELVGELKNYCLERKKTNSKPETAWVIQFSGENAKGIVNVLLEHGANVEVHLGDIVQTRVLCNAHQAGLIQKNQFANFDNHARPDEPRPEYGEWKLFRYNAPASFRAVLIDDDFVAVGSYLYMVRKIKDVVLDIRGGEKPMFVMRAGHPHFRKVADMVRELIDNWKKYWVTAERDRETDVYE